MDILLTKEQINLSWSAFSPELDRYFRIIFAILGEREKMHPLVAKYGLLKHLAKSKLRDHAIAEFDPKSFGFGWIDTQKAVTPREEIPC